MQAKQDEIEEESDRQREREEERRWWSITRIKIIPVNGVVEEAHEMKKKDELRQHDGYEAARQQEKE